MTFAELVKLAFTRFRLWVDVAPWECCVRVRLGSRVKTLRKGFHLLLPVVDRIYRFSREVRTSNVYAQTLTTEGGQTVSLRAVVRWRISDLRKLLESSASPEDELMDVIATSIADAVVTSRGNIPLSFSSNFVDLPGREVLSIRLTDFVLCRTYRLLNDNMTEHTWADKVKVENPLS